MERVVVFVVIFGRRKSRGEISWSFVGGCTRSGSSCFSSYEEVGFHLVVSVDYLAFVSCFEDV